MNKGLILWVLFILFKGGAKPEKINKNQTSLSAPKIPVSIFFQYHLGSLDHG